MGTGTQLRATTRVEYHKSVQFAAALGYYGLICLADRTILSPLFGYQGLTYRSASTWTDIYVLGLILLCTALTPVCYRQPSDGVLYALLLLVVIPVLAVAATDPVFANVAGDLIVSISGAYLLLAALSMVPRPPRQSADHPPLRQPWIIAVVLSVASYGMMFATFGIQFRLLTFSDVYNVRTVFTDQASGPLNYLLNWQANVINPLFIVYGVRSRRSLLFVAGILGDLLIYSTTGYKSVLFSALVAMTILFALRKKALAVTRPATGMGIGVAFAALVTVAVAIDRVNHSIFWTSLFVRRMSLVAGVNTGYYFQHFSSSPKAHLAYGLIGAVLGKDGVTPPPQQIAFAVYHTAVGDPNANIWADAYANFGYVGVVAFTLILAGFLWVYDRVAQNSDRRTAMVLITVSALTLVNSALFACLLTHGMLLALLVIRQCPQIDQWAEESRKRQGGYDHPGLAGLTVR